MMTKYYQHFKPITKKVGIHPILSSLHRKYTRPLKIIRREELRNRANRVYEFGSSEKFSIPEPHTINPDIYENSLELNTDFEYNKPFVAEVQNGRVLNHVGICTTSDYEIILDSDRSKERSLRKQISKSDLRKLDLLFNQKVGGNSLSKPDLDTAVAFTSVIRPSGYLNYYAWVRNYLTKLEGVNQYYKQTGRKPKIIIPRGSPSWVVESLELFGYENEITYWDSRDELLIERLIIPSGRRLEDLPDGDYHGPMKDISRNAIKWMRNTALCQVDNQKEFSNKVFISRADAGRRHLENRDTILRELEKQGFESHQLEDLSFSKQVTLFAQADEIIGVHGAGFTNILFSQNCNITELFGDKIKLTYYVFSKLNGLDYQAVSGQSIKKSHSKPRHRNIKIEPERIIEAIAQS